MSLFLLACGSNDSDKEALSAVEDYAYYLTIVDQKACEYLTEKAQEDLTRQVQEDLEETPGGCYSAMAILKDYFPIEKESKKEILKDFQVVDLEVNGDEGQATLKIENNEEVKIDLVKKDDLWLLDNSLIGVS